MNQSVICCIYNTEPLVRRTLESLRKTASPFTEVILVDNHSPDEAARDLIYKQDWVKVVDPGKNLGCHDGWNYGFQYSTGRYVCKLDDDTEILTPDWGSKMSEALRLCEDIAYVSADIDAKQANNYLTCERFGHTFEIPDRGIVGFSFVMFRREDVIRWGLMKTGLYRAAGGRPVAGDRLYGGEEVYFAQAAANEGKKIAHYPPVKCHHADNAERHPFYPLWKYCYGYTAWTSKEMQDWIDSGDAQKHCRCAIAHSASQATTNDAELVMWLNLLVGFPCERDHALIEAVMERTKNGAVHEKCLAVLDSIAMGARKGMSS